MPRDRVALTPIAPILLLTVETRDSAAVLVSKGFDLGVIICAAAAS
jgi:hypothetical protein